MVQSGLPLRLKRALDVSGALFGLAATAPVLIAAAIAVQTTMGRPVLFRQARPGKNAKSFILVKFRTMRVPKPDETGSESDAARLTPIGRFLRATSIDELPQLFNILRGDLSLVGPRPVLETYLERYTRTQARRHEVLPGLTGWAQVNGRNAVSWEEKFRMDVWYVDNWSLGLDVRILLMTALKVFRREGISGAGHVTMPEFKGIEAQPTSPITRTA